VPARALASRLLPLLDLTSLGEDDTPAAIEALCARARVAPVPPAAVCIHPEHVTTARRALHVTPVRIATVVNFPDGGEDADRVARETRRALAAGADEIDVVFAWRAFLRGDAQIARDAIVAARRAGAGATLKLILETGELATPAAIRAASELGIAAGVDFLQTSTGKAAVNATPEAAVVMLDAIAAAGGRCGFKAAGGVRTLAQAAGYLDLARARMGEAWIDATRFRIGASTLFDSLIIALDA
jgi:deoxyribose-phosphate aldolase